MYFILWQSGHNNIPGTLLEKGGRLGHAKEQIFHCCHRVKTTHTKKERNIRRKISRVCKMSAHLKYFFLLREHSKKRGTQRKNVLVVPLVSNKSSGPVRACYSRLKRKLKLQKIVPKINKGKQNYKPLKD